MSDLKYPSLQEPVRLALMELDREELRRKITIALLAIDERRAELQNSADSREERIALNDAIVSLKAVQRETAA
jgi:hypothetical protein